MGKASGFTLLEVLVAFAVFAITTAAVMGSIGTGLNSSRVSAQHAVATLIAQSKLAAAGVESPLNGGAANGVMPGGYRWQVAARLHPVDGSDDRIVRPYRVYDVTVTVAWSEGLRNRSVALQSLRYGPGE